MVTREIWKSCRREAISVGPWRTSMGLVLQRWEWEGDAEEGTSVSKGTGARNHEAHGGEWWVLSDWEAESPAGGGLGALG